MDHREGQDQGKEREARSWEDQYDKILRSSNLVRQCADGRLLNIRAATRTCESTPLTVLVFLSFSSPSLWRPPGFLFGCGLIFLLVEHGLWSRPCLIITVHQSRPLMPSAILGKTVFRLNPLLD